MGRAVVVKALPNVKLAERFLVWDKAFSKCDDARADVERFGAEAVLAYRHSFDPVMTQEKLADQLGTKRSYVSALEAGRQGLSREMIRRIAALIENQT